MNLQERIKRRIRRRDNQLKMFEQTGKEGHRKAFQRERKALLKLREIAAKRREAIVKELQAGWPYWAGGKRIMRTEVWPLVKKRGIAPTSGKRTNSFGNIFSDHFWLNRLAFAKDYATDSNFALATEIRRALTGDSNAKHVDYQNFYIVRYGYVYRVQIIAGTHGTGPHLHVGIKRERKA